MLGRGACCSQDVWGLYGFSLTFHGFSFFSWDLLGYGTPRFLHLEITTGKSGDSPVRIRWRKHSATRVLRVSFHNTLWALGLLSGALLQYLQSNWTSHIRETRLLNECTDNLQIQSITAPSDHVGESARPGQQWYTAWATPSTWEGVLLSSQVELQEPESHNIDGLVSYSSHLSVFHSSALEMGHLGQGSTHPKSSLA